MVEWHRRPRPCPDVEPRGRGVVLCRPARAGWPADLVCKPSGPRRRETRPATADRNSSADHRAVRRRCAGVLPHLSAMDWRDPATPDDLVHPRHGRRGRGGLGQGRARRRRSGDKIRQDRRSICGGMLADRRHDLHHRLHTTEWAGDTIDRHVVADRDQTGPVRPCRCRDCRAHGVSGARADPVVHGPGQPGDEIPREDLLRCLPLAVRRHLWLFCRAAPAECPPGRLFHPGQRRSCPDRDHRGHSRHGDPELLPDREPGPEALPPHRAATSEQAPASPRRHRKPRDPQVSSPPQRSPPCPRQPKVRALTGNTLKLPLCPPNQAISRQRGTPP